MIVKILLIIMIIIAVFLYLVILGASKNKTARERELEDIEEMKYLKNYNSRRQKNDRQNKKK